MQHRRNAGLTARLLAVVAVLASTIGIALVATAPPASAAGSWVNPGNWSFYNVDGAMLLAGRGSDPGLFAPTAPYECNNGTNDDANAANGGSPSNYQDLNADFGSATPDAECASAVDDSEVNGALQTRTPVHVNGAVAAGGAITVATPGTNVVFPTIYQYTNQTNLPLGININGVTSVTITATSASGNLDPATGAGTMNIGLSIVINAPVLGACDPMTVNLAATTGTSGAITGSAYNSATGLLTVVDNTFTIPAATGGFFGQCSQVNPAFGLPAAAGASTLRLQMRVLPNPVVAQPTVTGVSGLPGTVHEGDTLTLTPTATDPDTTLVASGAATTPPPSWNWRWTQLTAGAPAGGTIADATFITSPVVAGDQGILNNMNMVNGQVKFIVPKPGNYSFRVQAGNGGSVNFGTAFTLNFTAIASTVTVNAGPDLTASGGQAAATNPIKLSSTTTSPAPADAVGRTYAWTQAAVGPNNTCGVANPLTITTPTAQTSTFATPSPVADCFVDVTETTTVNGKNGNDVVRVTVKAATAGQIKGTVTCNPACATGGTVYAWDATFTTLRTAAFPAGGGAFTVTPAGTGPYKIMFSGTGVNPRWWRGSDPGVTSSSSAKPITLPYAGADITLFGGTSAAGTLNATVNVLPSGLAPNGTAVRLYDAAGQYVAKTVTAAGIASFGGLPTGNYKVNFAKGNATYNERWADTGMTVSAAKPYLVTSGGGPTAVSTTLTLKGVAADFNFAYDGGIMTAVANNGLTDAGLNGVSGKAWTANQWAGFKVRSWGGRDGGNTGGVMAGAQIRTILSNTGNALTLTANWARNPEAGINNYQILPAKYLGLTGTGAATTLNDNTQAWPNLAGYQVTILFGTGAGQTRTIASNTAVTLTVSAAWTTIPDGTSGYQIIPLKANNNGTISGWAMQGNNGYSMNFGAVAEARVYDATTGMFVGKTNPTGVASPTGRASNYSFIKWTADPTAPNAQNGLPPGTYKVLYRVIGAGGGAPAFCSTWVPSGYSHAGGGPAQGGWVGAASLTVTAGTDTGGDVDIRQNASCTATN